MEKLMLHTDIKAWCIEANPFPEGISTAFQKLFAFFPEDDGRKILGISKSEHGKIRYWVAAEIVKSDDLLNCNLPVLIIKKGEYIGTWVKDYIKDIPSIGKTFRELTSIPNLDPDAFCVEWYQGDNDVLCLVKLI